MLTREIAHGFYVDVALCAMPLHRLRAASLEGERFGSRRRTRSCPYSEEDDFAASLITEEGAAKTAPSSYKYKQLS
jgi:hypothetical protein